MRLLVTGTQGQVVRSLVERCAADPEVDVVTAGRPRFDLGSPSNLTEIMHEVRPDVVVSTAAYTAVDLAEDEPAAAFAVNADGAGAVAAAAAKSGVPIIHLSTDYVFDGSKAGAYVETDSTNPLGVYGRSKLAGELAVAAANSRHLILRTAWVYSRFGKNFAKTMLRLAKTRGELRVVSDQWGNPTSAADIADCIVEAAARLIDGPAFDQWGVYHLAGNGDTNWSGFARHILDTSRKHGGPFATVTDITTSDYPTKARRPANSRLACGKLESQFGWRAPSWRRSTDLAVELILQGG